MTNSLKVKYNGSILDVGSSVGLAVPNGGAGGQYLYYNKKNSIGWGWWNKLIDIGAYATKVWNKRTLPVSTYWYSVCWSPELGLFCAVAGGPSTIAATSPDGIIWTQRTLPASAEWYSVCWSPELGLFCTVAVGPSTIAATSPDGITWTQRTLPTSANWHSICWSSELGLFCTVAGYYTNPTNIAATSRKVY